MEMRNGRFDIKSFMQNETNDTFYEKSDGCLLLGDCRNILPKLREDSVDLIFADPPYSIGKAEWDVFANEEEYLRFSLEWIEAASRILKPEGTLYICGFTEILAGIYYFAKKYFYSGKWLIWYYKNKANLGNDWGRSHESILCLRKSNKFTMNVDAVRIPYNAHTLRYPVHPQAESSQYGNKPSKWIPNPLGAKPKDVIEVPTTCNGMGEKTPHPTQKPEELVRRFILASSNENDVVLDPFVGSGTTVVCARQLGRRWIGIDQNPEYLEWGIRRLENVDSKTVRDWIDHDKANVLRRGKIR